jgi:hypothetical protein
MPPDWIEKSHQVIWYLSWHSLLTQEGEFLPEADFGKRLRSPPFEKKRFYVTPEFKSASDAEMKLGHLETLIVEASFALS